MGEAYIISFLQMRILRIRTVNRIGQGQTAELGCEGSTSYSQPSCWTSELPTKSCFIKLKEWVCYCSFYIVCLQAKWFCLFRAVEISLILKALLWIWPRKLHKMTAKPHMGLMLPSCKMGIFLFPCRANGNGPVGLVAEAPRWCDARAHSVLVCSLSLHVNVKMGNLISEDERSRGRAGIDLNH